MSSAFVLRGYSAKLGLQPGDLRLCVAGGEALLQLGGDRRRQRVAGARRSGRRAEHSAEGEDGGGQCRRRPCDEQTPLH